MNKLFLIIMFLTLTSLILNCKGKTDSSQSEITQNEIDTSSAIFPGEKLFTGIELPVYKEKIMPDKDQKLMMPTGAEMKIPSGAFIDKQGNEVKSEITIHYKEIKSPADIIIENVDMSYDSLGKTYQFATAGMFELRAYSDAGELALKQGKSIELSYISNQSGHYNFYYYDKGWKYQGSPKENIPLQHTIDADPDVGLLMPTPVNTEKDLILDIKINHKNFPELSVYKNILWKYSGKLSAEEAGQILQEPVSGSSLAAGVKKGEYLYKFSTAKGKYEFQVQPVFSAKLMKEALNSYHASLAKSSKQQGIKRMVDVTKLGLMNYDIIYQRPDALLVKVDFKVKNNDGLKVQGLPLFHITGEDNVIVNITDTRDIYYSPAQKNKIVAVLPDKKLAVMGTADFIKAMQKSQNLRQVLLELIETGEPVKSHDDLNSIISGL
jgi:hypothetical protein